LPRLCGIDGRIRSEIRNRKRIRSEERLLRLEDEGFGPERGQLNPTSEN
jgi:hypothetical protein